MTSCFPFFSKKSKRDRKNSRANDLDDVHTTAPAVKSTNTPIVNTPEAEALAVTKPVDEATPKAITTPTPAQPAPEVISTAGNPLPPQEPDEPEVTTHVHTHEVVTIKEFIPNPEADNKAMAAELRAAQAELKAAEVRLAALQEENVNLLEKSVENNKLKKKNEECEAELNALKAQLNEQKAVVNKAKDEVKNYQVHINTAGQEINLLRRKLNNAKHNELEKTVNLLLTGLKEAYDEINRLDEVEHDYNIMANETGEEIFELTRKLRDGSILINECGQELIDTKAENVELHRENEVFARIIECLVAELKAANQKINNYQQNTEELLLIANETGEEIIKLQQIHHDKTTAITESGQEICNLKAEMNELKRENTLLKEVFKALCNEYEVTRKANDELQAKENDLLVLANEAGEEITELRRAKRDGISSINEAATELIETKAENESLKKSVEQYITLIQGISEAFVKTNGQVDKLENENSDLMVLANESGEEITELKATIRDNIKLVNESCQELIDTKAKLLDATQQNEAYLSFIVAIGEQFKLMADENAHLTNEKEDTYVLANEIGEEIVKLQSKLKDSNNTLNECGTELIETKTELENVKNANNNYEQIIAGLVEMLNKAKSDITKMEEKERDLLELANETGEEIRSLRIKKDDARIIANETGAELVELKEELARAKEEINKYKEQIKNNIAKKIEDMATNNNTVNKMDKQVTV